MQQGSTHCCHKNGNNKILHFCSRRSLYWFFAVLRLLLNFIPQTGYIHPDEFFQYIEVAAGNNFFKWTPIKFRVRLNFNICFFQVILLI